MSNDKKKKRINLLVDESLKNRWEKYVDESEDISTISKLIRKSVDQYIDSQFNLGQIGKLNNYAHQIKEDLSVIMGVSEMLIKDYKDVLDFEILLKIKEILDRSNSIENLMKIIQSTDKTEKEDYDILIIEDHGSTRSLISSYFKKRGYSCKTAPLGSTALELLQISTPKLILLDILLPDISGYDICKRLKANENLKNIPIYYITAVPEVEVEKKLDETGAEGYFSKPFNWDEFDKLKVYLN